MYRRMERRPEPRFQGFEDGILSPKGCNDIMTFNPHWGLQLSPHPAAKGNRPPESCRVGSSNTGFMFPLHIQLLRIPRLLSQRC